MAFEPGSQNLSYGFVSLASMTHAFFEFWRQRFASIPPISSVVRDYNRNRWMRRHALPESKRYADTPEETSEVLRRANAIGSELFRDHPDCWLVHASYENSLEPQPHFLGLEFAFHDVDPTADSGCPPVAIHAARVRWVAGAFDNAFRGIANEEIYSLIWVSVATGTVFAPYDGGFDIVFPTAQDLLQHEGLWPEWRSTHPGGW
jgi:hypothetical protein